MDCEGGCRGANEDVVDGWRRASSLRGIASRPLPCRRDSMSVASVAR